MKPFSLQATVYSLRIHSIRNSASIKIIHWDSSRSCTRRKRTDFLAELWWKKKAFRLRRTKSAESFPQ